MYSAASQGQVVDEHGRGGGTGRGDSGGGRGDAHLRGVLRTVATEQLGGLVQVGLACVESPAARLVVVSEAAGTRESVHADILARARR